VTPLTAAQARSELVAEPVGSAIGQSIEVLLKFQNNVNPQAGLTGAGSLNGLLAAIGNGIPQFSHTDMSRGHIKAHFDANSNRIPVATLGETDISAWVQNAATGSVARDTGAGNFVADGGVASAKQTNPGSNANEGLQIDWVPADPKLIQGQRVRCGLWIKGNAGSEAVRIDVAEGTGGSFTTTNGSALTLSTAWQFVSTVRTFGATPDTARMVIHQTAQAATAWFVDTPMLAAQSLWGNVVNLQPASTSADPNEVALLLKFNGVSFVPAMLYDALDSIYGTVVSDKDDEARGTYQFSITS
jgi:hypothetical protein